ncbi:RDD family protein [Luteolibacter yonseiensis]|uniref:RDD family protein n=1 Tax=Luteolibacter yonseiensis TaxID=1144680 RepID=A0A934R641_9BACT|nr:RDD family protein [Luteolibacter yonseiensis]MBK1817677.1 RDD family protein [Luteolibacter yonseiensis]
MKTKSDGGDESATGAVNFNTRATAAVIDGVISTGITILLALLLPTKVAMLGGFAYLVIRDSLPFLGGQSVGKKAMKIQAVTLEGKSLISDWQTALIRNGPLLIPLFAFVELYILLTREEKPERGRRLGDEWAKTKVIVETKPSQQDEIG